MGKPNETILRSLSFDQEIRNCLKLIKCGLALIQADKIYQEKHFVFMLLLSSGLERLLKIVLYLHVYETESRYLTQGELKKLGHNLESLLTKVREQCFVGEYMSKPWAKDDLDFLESDGQFLRMIKLLSEFAKRDRYIYMDGMTDPSLLGESPEKLWEEFQSDTIPEEEGVNMLVDNMHEEYVDQANRNTVIYIEKLLRAIVRLFIFNVLGTDGKRYMGLLREFSIWEDSDLGTKEYSC